jgi:hypothetical protein
MTVLQQAAVRKKAGTSKPKGPAPDSSSKGRAYRTPLVVEDAQAMLAASRETKRKEAAWEIYALSRTPLLGCYVPLMSKTRRRPTEIRE